MDAVVQPVEAEPKNVEFAHYFDANGLRGKKTRTGDTVTTVSDTTDTEAGLYTAYHDASEAAGLVYNATKNTAFKSENVLYRVFKVTLSAPSAGTTINGVHYSQLEIAEKLNDRTAKITFTSNSRARYLAASDASTVTIAAGQTTASFTKALSGLYVADADSETEGSQPGVANIIAYFAVYVEGDNASTPTPEDSVSAQTFTISIEDNSATY